MEGGGGRGRRGKEGGEREREIKPHSVLGVYTAVKLHVFEALECRFIQVHWDIQEVYMYLHTKLLSSKSETHLEWSLSKEQINYRARPYSSAKRER